MPVHDPLAAAIKNAVASWKTTVSAVDKKFAAMSDDDLQREIAPGKNRVFYLLGHFVAVHDRMLPLLRLGDRLYPELDQAFLSDPDRKHPDQVTAGQLRAAWAAVSAKLNGAIDACPAEDWLQRHDAVSDEDFAKEPHRNRLGVLLSRTAHAAFHSGQITLVAPAK
jgi:hypothetical protein